MSLGDNAIKIHKPGVNCAQCVLLSASEYTNLDDNIALKIASAFGGGLKRGKICGAVSGAAMALGICGKGNDIGPLIDDFEIQFGSCICKELKGVSGIPCDDLIEYAANKVEEVIKNGNL